MCGEARTGKRSSSKVSQNELKNGTLLAHLWLRIIFCTQIFLDDSTLDIVQGDYMKEGPVDE